MSALHRQFASFHTEEDIIVYLAVYKGDAEKPYVVLNACYLTSRRYIIPIEDALALD